MNIRTLTLITLFLCASVAYAAAESNYRSDPKAAKVEKVKEDKDKDKNKVVAVRVPDGDPSTALLLSMGVVGLGVFAMRRRTAQDS